ncbi:nucleotide-diphospho-sugar transferase [Pavlovales sp. CCMP2436]|nr:nucleotide-diphospho-sugar transferase [Pavlovales sp. CCMP2436]
MWRVAALLHHWQQGRVAPALGERRAGSVSVVIPVYNERESILRTLELCRRRAARPSELEIVVVDGGSTDGTAEALVEEAAAAEDGCPTLRVLSARGGRGHALRAGAEAARGELLLMLHAECAPPPAFDELCAQTLADPAVALGAFSFRIDRGSFAKAPPRGIGFVERFANARARAPFFMPYGDQGLHVRAADLGEAGGVPAVAIMEDVVLVRRLLAAGARASPPRQLLVRDEAVECSGRRWEQHGVVRVTVLNQLFMLAHGLGFSPDDIYTAYYGKPPPTAAAGA